MVLARPRGRRLRLELLDDRLTLGDIVSQFVTPPAGVNWIEPAGNRRPDDSRPIRDDDASNPAAGPGPVVSTGLLIVAQHIGQDAARDEAGPLQPMPASPDAGSNGFALADMIGPSLSSTGGKEFGAFAAAGVRVTSAAPEPPGAGIDLGTQLAVADLTPAVDPQFSLITARNRNSATMTGGWNPALRGIMVMNDGSQWFAAETGTSAIVNSAMVYYRQGPTGWKAVGSVALPPGIQQNMATITNGRFIYAYGVTRGTVIETWFDTTHPGWNLVTGNAMRASGRVIAPGAQANYVGAAWHNNARIVWWSTVGANGTGGTWFDTYNVGGGWNGPFASSLGGYGSLGYVRSRIDDQGRLRLLGEGHVGLYPAGRFDLMEATLIPGAVQGVHWARVLPGVAHSTDDLWPAAAGGTHYLFRTDLLFDTIGYWYGPQGGAQPVIFPALEGRFVAAGDRFALVLAYQHSIEVRIVSRAAADAGPIDWTSVTPITIPLPTALDPPGGISAIWTSDEARQPTPSDRLEFAVCGGYPTRDNFIYYVSLD
jgi:hypothetical protein